MNKKAFRSNAVGNIQLLEFKTGSTLYMPMQVPFSDQHASLTMVMQQEFYHTAPMRGAITSAKMNEDASFEVSVILLDDAGKPIPGDGMPFKMKTFVATGEDTVGINQWCDDEKVVNELCIKKNKQTNAGIKELMNTFMEIISFNEQANRLIEKSIGQEESEDMSATVLLKDKSTSGGKDYFKKEKSELKEEAKKEEA